MMPMIQGAIRCKNGNTSSFSQLSQVMEVSFVHALRTMRNSTIGKRVLPCTNTQTNWGIVVGNSLPAIQSSSSNQNGNQNEKPNLLLRNCVPSSWFLNGLKKAKQILLVSMYLLMQVKDEGDLKVLHK